jgi:hypothetical protein
MNRLDEPVSEKTQTGAEQAAATPNSPADAATNGTASASASAGQRSGRHRAEELADRLAHQVAYVSSLCTRKLVSWASRAREATQDFWAEVQDFRHGVKPDQQDDNVTK